MAFRSLCKDVEKQILSYLDEAAYMNFTATCREYRTYHSTHLWQNASTNTRKMLTKVLDEEKNVLLHGPGGCGKTHALTMLHKMAKRAGRRIVMTGTTGVSSTGMPEGMTIHSFSGLGKGTIPYDKLVQECTLSPTKAMTKYRQWRTIDILVIDEISMMGTRLFRLLDYLAKFIREDARPFGGVQVVVSGDFLQLPPIGDQFVFTCPAWEHLNLACVPFLSPYRQKADGAFFRMLQRIRMGLQTPHDIEKLESRQIDKVPEFITQDVGKKIVPPFMFSRHQQVNDLNRQRLETLPVEEKLVQAEDSFVVYTTRRDPITGENRSHREEYHGPPIVITPSLRDRIEHRQPALLPLKHLAQYILTQNYRTHLKLVNGSVALFNAERGVLNFANGSDVDIASLRSTQYYRAAAQSNVYLKRVQFSLRVGYAITIHSAQGMTLDQAVVNAGTSVFASAQTYVACSRVRNLKDLYLLDFNVRSLKVHKEARKHVAGLEGINLEEVAKKPPKKKRKTKALANTDSTVCLF